MSLCLINVVGHNGSGKTTLAKKLSATLPLNRVNGDDFRNFVSQNINFFKDFPLSHPTELGKVLNPLVIDYRFMMAAALLRSGQNVIFDGSGATKSDRETIFKKLDELGLNFKRIIIYITLNEDELLKRLALRDEATDDVWVEQYKTRKKILFEPPMPEEADELLVYTQNNYDDIAQSILTLLDKKQS